MRPAIFLHLILLGMIWGSSFLFQRITVPVLGAGLTASMRIVLAAAVLAGMLAVLRRPLHWRRRWRDYMVVGAINSGVPFLMFAFAAYSLPAGYLAVLNATVPMFTVLIGWLSGVRPSNSKLAGVVVGIAGVAVLVQFGTVVMTRMAVAAFAAVLFASVLYAFGARAVRARFANDDPLTVACGTMTGSMLPLLPLAWYDLPQQIPSSHVLGSLAALGVLCTGIAYAMFYRVIREAGTDRAVTVTFLTPVFAEIWGAIFLGEAITWASVVGGGLVLFAVALIFEKVPGLRPRSG